MCILLGIEKKKIIKIYNNKLMNNKYVMKKIKNLIQEIEKLKYLFNFLYL